jgi:hypothetical protein
MIRAINGWFYLVNLGGAFHGFPFPTKVDAEEALHALKAGVP